MEYKLVETQSELDAYLQEIKKCDYIAVDTEFIRSTTYYPRPSLVQICFKPQFAILIDCVRIPNLEPLLDIIYDPNIIKVFHAARQDLEIFYYKRHNLPKNIFDTQLAVMLLNFPKDISYEKMVKALLNVDVDKSQTHSDWLKRPLSAKQLQYAANDVFYLYEIYPIIIKLLEKHKHGHWLENLFAPLMDANTYENRNAKDIAKLSHDFSPEILSLIYNILIWREDMAKRLDIPRNNVIDMDIIKEIAKNLPLNYQALKKIVGNKFKEEYLEHIFSIISAEDTLPFSIEKTPSLNKDQVAIYNLFKILLQHVAAEQKVNEYLIANNEELIDFILHGENSHARFLQGWRFEVFGNLAVDFLNAKKAIKIQDGKVVLE
ncbi:MAG: HRDC domain-containing protein [Alphaproteobacteria bacterium]|jgi:ribonuclease D|nr:HRDC domain-containing protein [Alphaproteobacteria bacterium]